MRIWHMFVDFSNKSNTFKNFQIVYCMNVYKRQSMCRAFTMWIWHIFVDLLNKSNTLKKF